MNQRALASPLRLAVLVATAVALPRPAAAQVPLQISRLLAGGYAVEAYRFAAPDQVGYRSLEMSVAPLAFAMPVAGARLSLTSAYATGRLERQDGARMSIAGWTDSQLTLDLPVARDASVTIAAALPSGHATHTRAEAEVSGIFATDLLPFRVSNWGSGGSVGISSTVARELGGFGLGVSAGYSMAREYSPLAEDQWAYRPGDELRVAVAVDRSIRRTSKASLRMSLHRYSEDLMDGQNLYRSGNRYSAIGSYAFALGYRGSSVAYLGLLHRERGAYLDRSDFGPSQDLLIGGAAGRFPVGGAVLVPALDGRLFRSGDGVGQGYIASAGTALEWPVGRLQLVPAVRGRFGTLVIRQGAESRVTGLDLSLMVRHVAER